MRIWHIKIERFRGIRELDWRVGGEFVCLVGPGNSRKTTILDAVEFALSPRWSIPFDDSEFYDGATDQSVVITVTVGDVSDEFKSDAKFGYLARLSTYSGMPRFALGRRVRGEPGSRLVPPSLKLRRTRAPTVPGGVQRGR